MSQKFISATIICLTLCSFAAQSSATTIIDTTAGNAFVPNGAGWAVSNLGSQSDQSVALPFSSPTATTITDITAYIVRDGPVDFGIKIDDGGLPGAFLFHQGVTPSFVVPLTLTSLNWSISAGTTYWLTAIASPGTSDSWEFIPGHIGPWAVGNGDGSSWALLSGTANPAAIISANEVVTPLPAALPLFATGLGAIGLLGWRRKKKAAALA